jgi:hypothetical protein
MMSWNLTLAHRTRKKGELGSFFIRAKGGVRPGVELDRSAHPAMPLQTTLSLREQLNGAVVKFLDDEGMACPKTRDGLVMLVNALAHYREEGKALFPEVFVFDSLEGVLGVLPESEYVQVGVDVKKAATMAMALKKCAPLARRGWAVYIERQATKFGYGLFRCGSTVVSLSPAEILINRGDREIPVFMLRQVAENVIQVSWVSESSLLVHFGATKEVEVSPLPKLRDFIDCLVRNVPGEVQEQVEAFYEKVLSGVLRASHGTLAAVVPARRRKLPKVFRDGTLLSPLISVAAKIAEAVTRSDCNSNAKLESCAALITGMLLSDGITVFGSDGTVRAFNVFVKHPRGSEGTLGGARTRTFKVLGGLVGIDLAGVLMQSQDGRVFCLPSKPNWGSLVLPLSLKCLTVQILIPFQALTRPSPTTMPFDWRKN